MMRLSRNTQYALKSAATFGLLGLALASVIVFNLSKVSDTWTLVLSASVASFALGYVLWRILCPGDRPSSVRQGILSGALMGLLAHPVAWYLAIVLNYMLHHPMFPDKPPLDPITAFYASFVYAFFSIILTGWLAVAAGAIAGFSPARVVNESLAC